MREVSGRLPNFFLAGTPKSGSTSLNRYLEQHPDIFMSPIKEPHYFADEVRIENFSPLFRSRAQPMIKVLRDFLDGPMTTHCSAGPVSEWTDYCRLFRHAGTETAVGESSVCYLWSRTAVRNIEARLPGARYLVMLRNPVERAYSQYVHMLSFAESTISFREHVENSLRSTSKQFSEMYPFLQFGFYAEQLDRLFQLVPRGRVHICYHEDFSREPATLLREIFGFLGVNSTFVPDCSERHMVARVPRSYPLRRWLKRTGVWQVAHFLPASLRSRLHRTVFRPRRDLAIEARDYAFLAEYYRRDVDKLSILLGRDFSHWLGGTPDPLQSTLASSARAKSP